MKKDFIAVNIVPTGIGAEIGGYVGDATPVTNLLASVCDCLITHPNVVNGVLLNCARENILYTEGFLLDQLFLGNIGLRPIKSNKIGVILDKLPEKKSINLAINTIEAIRTNKGIKIIGYTFTKKPVNGTAVKTKTGSFIGKIKDVNIFLEPAKELIDKGADAIAIATKVNVTKKDLDLYFKSKGANPYGGVEALISHTIGKVFNIQSAHAPILSSYESKQMLNRGIADPRAGADAITDAYLGCVLQGLHKAPKPIKIKETEDDDITIDDISALVVPASSLGGIPMLVAEKKNIPIIAVKENKTKLKVTNDKMKFKNVIIVDNYLEAAGILAAMKEGLSLDTLRRPIKNIKNIK